MIKMKKTNKKIVVMALLAFFAISIFPNGMIPNASAYVRSTFSLDTRYPYDPYNPNVPIHIYAFMESSYSVAYAHIYEKINGGSTWTLLESNWDVGQRVYYRTFDGAGTIQLYVKIYRTYTTTYYITNQWGYRQLVTATVTDLLSAETSPIYTNIEAHPDPDQDGLLTDFELDWSVAFNPNGNFIPNYSSDPNDADTDNDGLTDQQEYACTSEYAATLYLQYPQGYDLNPHDADCDDDGILDGQEIEYGTNPRSSDTDNDGVSDGDELIQRTNPCSDDEDNDGLTNRDEVEIYKTNPLIPDTNGNGLNDGVEVNAVYINEGSFCVTDPLVADTDRDEMPDGWEAQYYSDDRWDQFNPTYPLDKNVECDSDGLSNYWNIDSDWIPLYHVHQV